MSPPFEVINISAANEPVLLGKLPSILTGIDSLLESEKLVGLIETIQLTFALIFPESIYPPLFLIEKVLEKLVEACSLSISIVVGFSYNKGAFSEIP